jgi:hypothetical protein
MPAAPCHDCGIAAARARHLCGRDELDDRERYDDEQVSGKQT